MMNAPEMCHCRIWCRETGIAGGQGGYEKGCPQLNVRHMGLTTTWGKSPELLREYSTQGADGKWAGVKDHAPNLCLLHLKQHHDKGLPLGLITEDRPTEWGANHPSGMKEGKKIGWKCDPPDYTKTPGDHKYLLRDETTGKDLLRDKINKKVAGASDVIRKKDDKIARLEKRLALAEKHNRLLIHHHYKLPSLLMRSWKDGEWVAPDPDDDDVINEFKSFKKKLNTFRKDDRKEQRKVIKEDPTMANKEVNEVAWEMVKNPTDLIKMGEVEDLKEHFEDVDWETAPETEGMMREILFDLANQVVDDIEATNPETEMTEDWEEPIEDDEDVMAVMGGMIEYLEGQDFISKVLNPVQGRKTIIKNRSLGRRWLKGQSKKRSADWILGASKVIGALPVK